MTTPPTIPSPCTTVCEIDPRTGFCLGCMRTAEEITAWPTAGDAERLAILGRLKDRRRAAGRTGSRPRRRGGIQGQP